MCGRTACYLAAGDVSCSCKHKDASGNESEVPWVPEKFHSVQYVPSYNMGPRDTAACLVAGSHFNINESKRVLCPMMWGLIPPWHKGEYKKHNASTHNGRLEGLKTSKLYGKVLNQGKRCVVVINGFYEWKTDAESRSKQAYYMFKKSSEAGEKEVLYLAGLFDKWTSAEGETIYSCTVITTAANNVLSWLHHRAPVILETETDVQSWLNYKEVSAEKAVAKLEGMSLSENSIQWHPVANTVNNVRNKDKSCKDAVEIVKEKKKPAGGLMSAWLKTGSIKSTKRQSTDGDDSQDSESVQQRTKMLKKDS